eukprot:m.43819 g.43819  ORF g.43819 m.43819 type:complete len:676 (+) comp33477_c0_seq9:68-2095(+)
MAVVIWFWFSFLAGRCLHEVYGEEIGQYFFPEQDKFATDDPFLELAQAGAIKTYTVPFNLTKNMESLSHPSVTAYIEVILLGLKWTEVADPVLKASDLGSLLDSIHWDRDVRVAAEYNRALHLQRKAVFSVKQGSRDLENGIGSVLARYLASGSPEIPYSLVDGIFKEDYVSSSASSYRVYLFAFPYLANKQAYYYGLEDRKGCGNSLWIAKNRYVWIDLSAGPATITQHCGDDQSLIDGIALPRMEHHNDVDDLQSASFSGGIAALLYRIAEQLVFPPLQAIRHYSDSRHLTLHLFIIRDSPEDVGYGNVDWPRIRSLIGDLALFGQKLLYKMEKLSFFNCPHCIAAYSHALKTKLAKFNQSKSDIVLTDYLDSKELRHWLQKFRADFEVKSKADEDSSAFETYHTVPIYLFSLQTAEAVLLDGEKQAVAFDDMVVAIQTKAKASPCIIECLNGKFETVSSDLTRPVISALLNTIYGVMPSHLIGNRYENKTEPFYLWSTGLTPFGYLSSSSDLSFSLTDAIFRAPVLSTIEKYLVLVIHSAEHYMVFDVDVCSALNLLDCTELAMRWELCLYKIAKVSSLLSVNNYRHALYFSRSLRHEAESIKRILLEAESHTYPKLGCEGVPLRIRSIYGAVLLPLTSLLLLGLVSCVAVVTVKFELIGRRRKPRSKPKVL